MSAEKDVADIQRALIEAQELGHVPKKPDVQEAIKELPVGMTSPRFGELAGFEQGLEASGQALVEPSCDTVQNMKSAGISKEAVAAFQKFYADVASSNPQNYSAIHRATLLNNILKAY